jgi:RimJ/RimL family protein N-acetyltransferase
VWGRGLATEAARACVQWGFKEFGLRYLVALIEPANTRSIRVAQRLGMAPVRREFVFERDMVVHSVSAPG